MPDTQIDPYSVLKLPHGSSLDEIRQQYRRLARIYHPDRNPRDIAWCEEQLKELNSAFTLLSDPVTKAQFDSQSIPPRPEKGAEASFNKSDDVRPEGSPKRPVSTNTPRPREKTTASAASAALPTSGRPKRPATQPGQWVVPAISSIVAATLTLVLLHTFARPKLDQNARTVSAINNSSRSKFLAHRASSSRIVERHTGLRRRIATARSHWVHGQESSGDRVATDRSSDIALALAERAEARGRAQAARRLRAHGIPASGLNLSQMRRVEQSLQ